MAGKGNSNNLSSFPDNNINDEIYMIKKPSDNSSRKIRDAVLEDFFGYAVADIAALDEQRKGYFYISDDVAPKEWATAEQVRNWKTDAQGRVEIAMPQTLIRNLREFLNTRITSEINKATAFITDAALRTEVQGYLLKIFKSSGTERMFALDRLLVKVVGSLKLATKISKAVSYLVDNSNYKNNPFLALIKAEAAVTECRTKSGPGYCENATMLLFGVTNSLNEYSRNPQNSKLKTDRFDTAQINTRLSNMFGQLKDDKNAVDRQWIARFLNMSDDERDSYEEGNIIEIIQPGAKAIGTPSNTADKLENLKGNWKTRQAQEGDINIIGNPSPPSDPNADKYYTDFDQKLEIDGSVRVKKRTQTGPNQKRQPAYKKSQVSVPVFKQNRVKMVSNVGGGLHIISEVLKYAAANRRMNELADYMNRKQSLERQIAAQKVRVVPPKPQKIMQAINDLQKASNSIVNPPDRQKIRTAMRTLETMLEESNAFWKN